MAGLAQELAGPAPSQGVPAQMPSIEEIVALLMQGIPPEKLVEMGVPQEVIMEAITMLEQQMAAESAQGQAVPDQSQGLASSMVAG